MPALAADKDGKKDKPRRFSVGLTAGNYAPDLRQLNHALATPGLAILQDPNFLIPQNQDLPVGVRDVAAPALASQVNYGAEAQWVLTRRLSILVMALNWQGRSTISDTITMQLRSNLPSVQVPRTARYNFNLNQIWLGWRFNLFNEPKLGRLFINVGLAGLSVADFTIDALLKVNQPDQPRIRDFASISSTEFHGTSFSSRYGGGGEVFIGQNISLGFNFNYTFGEIQSFRVRRYFPSGFSELPPLPPETIAGLPDNVLPNIPALPLEGDVLSTAQVTVTRDNTEIVGESTPVSIDLDGWEFAFTLRIYY